MKSVTNDTSLRGVRRAIYGNLAAAFALMLGGLAKANGIEGVTFAQLWEPTAILCGTGVIGVVVSFLRFRWDQWERLAMWFDSAVVGAFFVLWVDSFVILYSDNKVAKDITSSLLGITQFYAAVFLFMFGVAGYLVWRQSIINVVRGKQIE